jgi:hypothetical protein
MDIFIILEVVRYFGYLYTKNNWVNGGLGFNGLGLVWAIHTLLNGPK